MHACLFAIFGSSETSLHVVKEIYIHDCARNCMVVHTGCKGSRDIGKIPVPTLFHHC